MSLWSYDLSCSLFCGTTNLPVKLEQSVIIILLIHFPAFLGVVKIFMLQVILMDCGS